MVKKLVHKGPSYELSVTTPFVNIGQTEEEALEFVLTVVIPRTFPDVSEIHVVDEDDIPGDHKCSVICEFAPAFEWRGNAVRVNMRQARVLKLDQFRAARGPLLERLDIEWIKALELGDQQRQKTIEGRKKALRNLPVTVDLSTDDPAKLHDVWPEILGRLVPTAS